MINLCIFIGFIVFWLVLAIIMEIMYKSSPYECTLYARCLAIPLLALIGTSIVWIAIGLLHYIVYNKF